MKSLSAILPAFTISLTVALSSLLMIASPVQANQGMASYYCCEFHGRMTASGERFNQHALTAAHRYLKFGTQIKVTNLNNGRSVIVRVTDRGPFVGGRVIDLSLGAARAIGMINSGVVSVRLQIL